MILVDANQDIWERRWFVLRRYCRVPLSSLVSGVHALPRPYLHVYKQSNEVEEITVISLDGVNVESNSDMESLLGVRRQIPPFRVCDTKIPKETVYLHTLYLLKLARIGGAESQGTTGMDH
jgi:hypothetical protein